MAGGIACSSGDSVTGTGGSGGAAGATAGTGGSGGNAGTGSGGTTGAAGSGGTSGGFVNAATCGERGMATVNATSYSGYAEFFIIGEAGLGTDVCAIRFNVARVGAAPAGCNQLQLVASGPVHQPDRDDQRRRRVRRERCHPGHRRRRASGPDRLEELERVLENHRSR
jgi:hypothetical protein